MTAQQKPCMVTVTFFVLGQEEVQEGEGEERKTI
jgi:hypothetical protein